jgi:UDP-glucose 4-epimerase
MKILVTGGAGYIGSHLCIALVESGFQPVVLDNFRNSRPAVIDRLAAIMESPIQVAIGDIGDAVFLDRVFVEHDFAAVMHLAGVKSVEESCRLPLLYYQTNVGGTLNLCAAMQRGGVRRLLFSSSATVYGAAAQSPVREDSPLLAANPYGRSKLMIERQLADLVAATGPDRSTAWRVAALRYFNPVGAHRSGLLGEDPVGIPNNLVPYVADVASGKRPHLNIYGNTYATRDGTGIRDYIHVMDLVEGHVAALRYLLREDTGGYFAWNLGTGHGSTVLEVVAAFERSSGRSVPYVMAPERPGDVAESWAHTGRAQVELGWRARRDLDEMMADVWRWRSANPDGMR